MRRGNGFRPLVVGAGVVLASAMAACGNGPPGGSSSSGGGGCTSGTAGVSLGTGQVKIDANDQLQFAPTSQTAHVGQVVQWTNAGSVAHTITFDSSNASCLDDAQIAPGSNWQVKFTQAGTYTYKCTIHPGMNGTLTVS
ncbi:MAG: cupredoxin domain-containing protein [Candidatus Dormibacteraeota bacterium]|nr:cupredoxin domain-containing protein [Candidatus Dormibacteraeota bacterium]MBV9526245.1 cupredoxin domain-containing protein [Candidatus Dormibacteraeota bacterium]